jgi:PST family polysaccharide transporter
LGATFGWEAAGYWEAMWRLSAAYMMIVTTTLSVYYLPRLSEIKTARLLKQEILGGYRFILPLAILCSSLMFIFRDPIITLLFSAEFYSVRELFIGQVIGDILKIGSWILAFTLLGKAMTGYFIATEVFFSISFYLLTVFMTPIAGLPGVSWAYALNYLLYWLAMYWLIFRKLETLGTHAPSNQLFNTKLQS